MEERRLSLAEAADALNISERTAYRWIKSGKLRAYKPGRDYWIPESAVTEIIEESLIRPKAPAPPSQPKLNHFPEEERRTPTPEQILEEAGIETRWLTMPTNQWRADLREAFTVPDEAAADRKLISVGWEILREYQELNRRMHSGPEGFSGNPTLAPEYADAWTRAYIRFAKTVAALQRTAENPNAPDEAREGARGLLTTWPQTSHADVRRFVEELEQELPIRGHA